MRIARILADGDGVQRSASTPRRSLSFDPPATPSPITLRSLAVHGEYSPVPSPIYEELRPRAPQPGPSRALEVSYYVVGDGHVHMERSLYNALTDNDSGNYVPAYAAEYQESDDDDGAVGGEENIRAIIAQIVASYPREEEEIISAIIAHIEATRPQTPDGVTLSVAVDPDDRVGARCIACEERTPRVVFGCGETPYCATCVTKNETAQAVSSDPQPIKCPFCRDPRVFPCKECLIAINDGGSTTMNCKKCNHYVINKLA